MGDSLPAQACCSVNDASFDKLSISTSLAVSKYIPKGELSSGAQQVHAQIQTADGNTYELLNTLGRVDSSRCMRQFQLYKQGKVTIASGGFGKIRFARNVDTNTVVVVKKMGAEFDAQGRVTDHKELAEHEIQQMKLIRERILAKNAEGMLDRFALSLDHAHVTRPAKPKDDAAAQAFSGLVGNKSYMFSAYASLGDGVEALERLHALMVNKKTKELGWRLLHVAKSYSKIVADLHGLGIHHRDIKPDNFLHYAPEKPTGLDRIKLTDFAFAKDQACQNEWDGETCPYAPPEARFDLRQDHYDARAHDVFSLGISLLCLKHLDYPYLIPNATHLYLKTLDGQTHPLTLTFFRDTRDEAGVKWRCNGVGAEHLDNLDFRHYDNIVAKLIATNKSDRMSAAQAYHYLSKLNPSALNI